MTKISAKVVADSVNPWGDRITSMEVVMPRIILAEFNTHRMFSRNSASSRAIPFKKMVEMIQTNPFIPVAWQVDHSGMQGTQYVENDVMIERCKRDWLEAASYSIKQADLLNRGFNAGEYKVTKQLCNRLLEPFMWHKVLVSATEWENFFQLRAPDYVFHDDNNEYHFRSKMDAINHFGADEPVEGLNTTLGKLSTLDWLKLSQSGAEIHIQLLAEAMWDALQSSTPKQLSSNQWHIPYINIIED